MKAKIISTTLKDLYGLDNYGKHIHVGDELWTDSKKLEELTGRRWNKIKITYIRSGILFFNIVGSDIEEQYFPINCFEIAVSIVAKLDPYKDLGDLVDGIDNFRFDDRFTEVVNFDNREDKEIGVDAEFDLYLF